MSASDLNQQITNPAGNVWSLQSQFQNFKLSNGQWNNVWNFQPALPVSLTKDWNLITRTVIPFYNIVPHETAPGEFKRAAGFGDITLSEIFSPAHAGNWLLGAGPTFIFPSASSTFTGQGKVAVGPVGLVGYMTKDFIVGVFPQQWFAIAGSPSRPYTSNLNLQPIATMFFGDGWDVGYSGNILANWRAPSGDVWTVPVGLNIGKVGSSDLCRSSYSLRGSTCPCTQTRVRSTISRSRSLRSSRSSSKVPCSNDGMGFTMNSTYSR
jgi:hypothetical protein